MFKWIGFSQNPTLPWGEVPPGAYEGFPSDAKNQKNSHFLHNIKIQSIY